MQTLAPIRELLGTSFAPTGSKHRQPIQLLPLPEVNKSITYQILPNACRVRRMPPRDVRLS